VLGLSEKIKLDFSVIKKSSCKFRKKKLPYN